MKKIKHKKAHYVQLNQPINCIPAGVYKVENFEDDESIQLSVSRKIAIAIFGNFKEHITCLSENEGISRRINRDDFLDEYYERLYLMKLSGDSSFSDPVTMCFLDPSLARQIH